MRILNGHLYPDEAPECRLLNRSFRFGDGLFETIRIYRGRPLFLDAHLHRLQQGMALLQIHPEAPDWEAKIRASIQQLLAHNQIDRHGKLRLHVYRDGEGAYTPMSDTAAYVMEAYALKEDFFASDVPLRLTDYRELLLQPGPLAAVKTANALPYVLAGRYARQQGYDDALLYSGPQVAESSRANLFVVQQQRVFTPPLSAGCLDGIMRRQVIDLCERLRIPCQEKGLKARD
ncbi:MAG: hypothetical protein D6722_05365, partial [Bacteroidetes bacterium]